MSAFTNSNLRRRISSAALVRSRHSQSKQHPSSKPEGSGGGSRLTHKIHPNAASKSASCVATAAGQCGPSCSRRQLRPQSDLTRACRVRGGLTYRPTKDPPASLWLRFQAPTGNATVAQSTSQLAEAAVGFREYRCSSIYRGAPEEHPSRSY